MKIDPEIIQMRKLVEQGYQAKDIAKMFYYTPDTVARKLQGYKTKLIRERNAECVKQSVEYLKEGKTYSEIAEILGMNFNTLSKLLAGKKDEVNKMKRDALKKKAMVLASKGLTNQEIASKMGLTENRVDHLIPGYKKKIRQSRDAQIVNLRKEKVSITKLGKIFNLSPRRVYSIIKNSNHPELARRIDSEITPGEKAIHKLYFNNHKPKSIAQKLGVKERRVRYVIYRDELHKKRGV